MYNEKCEPSKPICDLANALAMVFNLLDNYMNFTVFKTVIPNAMYVKIAFTIG